LKVRLSRNNAPSSSLASPWVHRWALLLAAATLVLLGAGGLVTSHGAGLAVPDWPNTYGYNMFFFPVSKWVGGIFYEHTHRLLATVVGLMTMGLALWLHGRGARRFLHWGGLLMAGGGIGVCLFVPGHRADGLVMAGAGLASVISGLFWPRCEPEARWLRWLGVAAIVAVVGQGVLGGLRVVLLKDQIGVVHATLAQLFFVLVSGIALFTSRWWRQSSSVRSSSEVPLPVQASGPLRMMGVLFLAATMLILAQLVLGATMRHQHAGLAIPDFPLAYGKLWPATDPQSVSSYNMHRIEVLAASPITAFQIQLQMVHRLHALCILLAVAGCAWLARRAFGGGFIISKLALIWLGLVLGQALLGAATVWSGKAADIATAHVVVGALSMALGGITTAILWRDSMASRKFAAGFSPSPAIKPASFNPLPVSNAN
jgi:heme a synthase